MFSITRDRLLGSLLSLTCLAGPALAQDPVVLTAGTCDDFALPSEPTLPTTELLLTIPDEKPFLDFDEVANNSRLGHVFTLPYCLDCENGENYLEVTVRATGDIAYNDNLVLQRSDTNGMRSDRLWGVRVGDLAGCSWGSPGCTEGTFRLNLCDLPGDGHVVTGIDEVATGIGLTGSLRVDFQDDTTVDCMRLVVTPGCCPWCAEDDSLRGAPILVPGPGRALDPRRGLDDGR
ncbi:MAG: hypothetical protein AAF533_28120 [Acidobacteriota bacterium]